MNPDEIPTPEQHPATTPVTPEAESSISEPVAEASSDEATSTPTPAEPTVEFVTNQVTPLNPMTELVTDITTGVTDQLVEQVTDLQQQEDNLRREVEALQATKAQVQQELSETQAAMGRLVQEAISQLEQRKQTLQIEVEKLERRRDRIQKEMRTTFAGVSQDLAIRVQGFKDYLVGSLQELVSTAEQLDLLPEVQETPKPAPSVEEPKPTAAAPATPKFAESGFQEQAKQIRRILDQYRTLPDYYGPPWQLRRTFEPIHAERVSHWFFTQGGKGGLRSMGSRLQNILIASTVISVLRTLYGGRLRTLVLANSPERLGEWRRGLQDCLGITRNDFGPERGIVLFEESEPLAQKADRLVKEGKLPLIVIDETEDQISLSMLQFPLWLAFAPDPQTLPPKEFESW
ncbi:MAG: DUF3086 domain-containing protein [Actinomycetota bacterium]